MTKPTKPCKDCVAEGITTPRPPIYPGPRCYTHHRQVVKLRKFQSHARRTETTYGITGVQYWKLYDAQGGRCFICRRATGATKRLAVDHDHRLCDDHPPDRGCPRCIRCLACGPCNELLGRYGIEALQRAIEVLSDPPARKILGT